MTGRNQVVVAAAGVAVILLLFFLFLVRPRQSELSVLQTQTAAEHDRTQQLETELERREALQRNAPELEAALDRMREQVPQNNQVAEVIYQVQAAANQAGVDFVDITPELPKQPPEGAALAEVRATIGSQGGYFAVQDFMRRLYDLDRALRIDNVTLTGVGEDQVAAEEGRVTVQMAARVFFELPEGAAGPAGTTPTTTSTPTPETTPSP